jgi:hypothetical protein
MISWSIWLRTGGCALAIMCLLPGSWLHAEKGRHSPQFDLTGSSFLYHISEGDNTLLVSMEMAKLTQSEASPYVFNPV